MGMAACSNSSSWEVERGTLGASWLARLVKIARLSQNSKPWVQPETLTQSRSRKEIGEDTGIYFGPHTCACTHTHVCPHTSRHICTPHTHVPTKE